MIIICSALSSLVHYKVLFLKPTGQKKHRETLKHMVEMIIFEGGRLINGKGTTWKELQELAKDEGVNWFQVYVPPVGDEVAKEEESISKTECLTIYSCLNV